MANSIALAQKFVPILDEIYKMESKTAILDTPANRVEFVGGNKVNLFKTSMDGLAEYSRNTGFVNGSVTGTWETLQLAYDRGTSFNIDNMDNEETLGMAFGSLAGEFVRTKVVPEVDAYRFAKYATAISPSIVKADITVGTTDCVGLIDAAEQTMQENEVPAEGKVLFVSPKMYAGIKAKVTRSLSTETGVQRNIEYFNDMPVIVVPQSRFNTAITLNDGSSSFGYAPTAGGYKINFMIVHPSAVTQIVKHVVPRIFAPEVNQTADAWKFDYRIYGDAFALENKLGGIYCHCANTANV